MGQTMRHPLLPMGVNIRRGLLQFFKHAQALGHAPGLGGAAAGIVGRGTVKHF